MSSPPKESVRERKQAIRDAWLRARRTILPALTDLLHTHLDSLWIDSPELFNNDTLPDTISLRSFGKGIWSNPDHHYQGTEVFCASPDERYHLLRHKFGTKWCGLWGCFIRRTLSIQNLVREAMRHRPGGCAIASRQFENVLTPLIVVLDEALTEVVLAQRSLPVVTPEPSS